MIMESAIEFLEPFLRALKKGEVDAFDGELDEIPLAIIALRDKIQEPAETNDFDNTVCRLESEIDSKKDEINRLQRIPTTDNDRCIELSDEWHNLLIDISVLKDAIHILRYSSIETIKLSLKSW